MSNLHQINGVPVYEMVRTYLFNKLAAANNNGRSGVIQLVIIPVYVPFFEIARYNELEFPSTLLPQIIQTWHPASG